MLIDIEDLCDAEDWVRARRLVGRVLGETWLEVLRPLLLEHPDLKP